MTIHGTFQANPQTEWVPEPNGNELHMVLLRDFVFTDAKGHDWTAKKKLKIDGASIPRFLWVLVGSPYTDKYRRASIVHDQYCVYSDETSKNDLVKGAADRIAADKMFHAACLAGGCGKIQAAEMYIGVSIGFLGTIFFPGNTDGPAKSLFLESELSLYTEEGAQDKFGTIQTRVAHLPLKGDESDLVMLDSIIGEIRDRRNL